MRYSAVALVAALTAAVSASPMAKRDAPSSNIRPYPSQSGRPFPSRGPRSSGAFPSWAPNPSHSPMPHDMSSDCELCNFSHFYYSDQCDDECKYTYDVYYYYEDCGCDKSAQPPYPTYECTTTAAPAPTTPTYSQNTVTVYVPPTEGCEEFLKKFPTCTYCETEAAATTYCETTVTSKTKTTQYVTSTPITRTANTKIVCETCEEEEETCGVATVTVTVSTTPCTTLATVTPCAGCVEQYVTTQGQLVSSCITSTSACSTYCTETTASMCVYGAMTTTVTYPTTITYTATTSCGSGDSFCNVNGQQYPCPTTVYYETVTECATGVFTLGGMTSACPTSACTVTYPTYCPATTTYAWYSTVTSACESCPVATVTAAECLMTSINTGYVATSTYCATAGVYTCGTEVVTIATPTWYHYVELCPTQYVCTYEEWCKQNRHFVVYEYIGTYLQEVYECDMNEYYEYGLWVHPVPTSQYFPQPTIVIINDIEINITVAPTWYVYDTTVTETTTSTVTSTVTGAIRPTTQNNPFSSLPSGAPSSNPSAPAPTGTFSLAGLVNGEPVVLVIVDGQLEASIDPNAVGAVFLPITNGILQDSNGNVCGLSALGATVTCAPPTSRMAKRGLSVTWKEGVDGPVCMYNGQPLVYSACSSSNTTYSVNLDVSAENGCAAFDPVKTTPGAQPDETPTGTPTAPTSAPTGEPTMTGTGPQSVAPSSAPSSAPNNTNNTNQTHQRRDFQRRFVF